MRLLLSILFLVLTFCIKAQVKGTVVDSKQIGIPGVKLKNLQSGKLARTSENGSFVIEAKENDTLIMSMLAFDSVVYFVKANDLNQSIEISLLESYQDVEGANVIRKQMEGFDVGFLPPVRGVQIYTGTNAVIELAELSGAKSAANPREIFAKVPGLNIWESDGAGIQVGIGGRGLSPNRTANFNTRQNGYDISADALGYPESYYTPPFEALKSIEIIRGSASLQFGSQFGGLLNFIIKDAPTNTPFEFTSRTTGGMFGYLGTFNRIAGSKNRVFYQAYHQYKRGDGYRDNSKFAQHQAFAQFGYYLTENIKIRLEYTHMNYLAKQAGGLSDLQFNENPRQSLRDRNWFKVNWNMLALHYDHEISKNSHFNVRAFGMASSRQTLGFLGKITQQDPGGTRDMLAGNFRNAGIEARFLQRYDFKRSDNKTKIRGAFLVGGRYYRGRTTADQGKATDGSDANFEYKNPDDLEGSAFTYPSENIAGFAENILFLGNRMTVNFGLRMESIQSGSSGYYKRYAVHPINLDTLAVYTIGDNNSVERFVPLFGAGTSFRTSKRSKVYANFTQNYRAINFTDIRISNPNIVIDSAIRDEYGYTMELGFRGIKEDFWIYDVAAFYVFYGDKIGLAPKSGTTFKERTNIGNARNMGIEVFTEFDFVKAFTDSSNHSFSLFVNAAYIDARYITSKEPNFIDKKVEYVSPFILKSGIKYKYKQWNFQIQGSYNSEQFSDASNSILPSGDAVIGLIPSYLVFDFSARYAFSKFVQLEAGVNNFTNERYFTRRAVAYPGPGILPSDGISAYLTIQFKFAK
jgi:Fe(3+) dicitrate transport protein